MPFHLPSLTRRQFLRTVAAGATLALYRDRLFAQESADPHTWALLSDTHISTDLLKQERGVTMAENMRGVIAEVAARQPARMLVNGDCAHHTGELTDYANFVELLQPVREKGIPIDLVLGNHDHRVHFRESIPGAAEREMQVEQRYVSIIETPRANWFLLDSLDQVNKTPGLLGEAQLGWLAKQLDAHPHKPAIICGHHTLNDLSKTGGGGLIDTAAFLDLLAPRRNVKAYLFGHSHRWEFGEHEGIHLINLPAVAYVFREGQPSGWVLASMQENGLRLELNALNKSHPAHGQIKEFTWRS